MSLTLRSVLRKSSASLACDFPCLMRASVNIEVCVLSCPAVTNTTRLRKSKLVDKGPLYSNRDLELGEKA
jgi:hypothetical protein